jgi:hypothetical protein
VVQDGDTLWSIAQAHYGSAWAWRRIHDANGGAIEDPSAIYPCQRVYIPRWGESPAPPPWAEPPARPRLADAPPLGGQGRGGCTGCGDGSHPPGEADAQGTADDD